MLATGVLKLKTKISDCPNECGEYSRVVFCTGISVLGFQVDILSDIHDQRKVLDGRLIDCADRVIHETRAEQNGQCEDA